MTYTPSLEEFLTQHQPDEDDNPEITGTGGALDAIARSMEALVSLVQRLDSQDSDVAAMREHYGQLVEEADTKQALIDQVLEVCKPSTSKLANSIRAVLEPKAAVGETPSDEPGAEGEPCQVHGWAHKFKTCEQVTAEQSAAPAEPPSVPAHDADVWEWRAYAIRLGHDNVEVGGMNRSQIRTMLGIEQPVGGAE